MGPVLVVESCKIVFLGQSLFTCSDTFAVWIYPLGTIHFVTDRQIDRQHYDN